MKTAAFARATAILAIAFVAVAAASPAAAAPPALPSGDTLFALSCDEGTTANLEVFAVATADAATTPVGSIPPGTDACAYQPAWDYTTGTAWVMYYDDVAKGAQLGTVDLTTGVTTLQFDILDAGDTVYFDAFTIDLNGDAWGLVLDMAGLHLWSISLVDGAATEAGVLAGVTNYTYAFATDPTTGTVYLLTQGGELFSVDTLAVTATSVGSAALAIDRYYGLQIDGNGVVWIAGYNQLDSDWESVLWSTPLSDFAGAGEFSGVFRTGGVNFYTFSLIIAPVPPPAPIVPATLPNMGMDATTPLVVGGLLLVTGAFVFLVARTRRSAA